MDNVIVCRVCYNNLTLENTHKNHDRICKCCENKRCRAKDDRCKAETISEYGGKCICCNEGNLIFLTIDHVDEDGAEERKRIKKGGGTKFYRWLKRQTYPKDRYQVLCFNCNFAKHVLGECPHQSQNKLPEPHLPPG